MKKKINKEILGYSEKIFFGLTLRQLIFSFMAVVVAVTLYFLLRNYISGELLSWLCMMGAAPFAAMGFITYHGMTAEQFVIRWIRSELLEPKHYTFAGQNLYYDIHMEAQKKNKKGGKQFHAKNG